MSDVNHRLAATGVVARCAVVTLSDTRTEQTDGSGSAIRRLLSEAGHLIGDYRILKDDAEALRSHLSQLLLRSDIDAILSNGGTGISRRDQTIRVIERAIERPLPGFGELFRMLSWEQVGSAAMLSRATAGISNGKLLVAMPGSTKAVELAMTRLILPEIGHLIGELRK
jgi:molybdenum cofactor biosynthesis protein B